MTAVAPQSPETVAASGAGLQRPARALIGWMNPNEARLTLAGRRTDADHPEHALCVEQARAAVAGRVPGLDQTNLVREAPVELREHLEALRQHPAGAPYFNEGWTVGLADLRTVCAIQPHVFVDHASQRVAEVDPGDLRSLASVSLPVPSPAQLPAQFDNIHQAWVFTAANPNLRIAGHFGGPLPGGAVGFGFVVAVLPSFLQVARYQGRYLLRDGYHRALGFLKRGITTVPAFVRDFDTFDDLGFNPGMLPQDSYLGQRPPVLVDYLDDAVSAEVMLPAIQKMVVIQGLELGFVG